MMRADRSSGRLVAGVGGRGGGAYLDEGWVGACLPEGAVGGGGIWADNADKYK